MLYFLFFSFLVLSLIKEIANKDNNFKNNQKIPERLSVTKVAFRKKKKKNHNSTPLLIFEKYVTIKENFGLLNYENNLSWRELQRCP